MKWKDWSPDSIKKLRSALDSEFKYVGINLSENGFKNAMKRPMKTERLKMKVCPIVIEPDQWDRLCEY